MLTASARAYARGSDTMARRKEIITTYLNSTPLSSMPGYGEVIGLPEALWIWFGTDYTEATKILNSTPRSSLYLSPSSTRHVMRGSRRRFRIFWLFAKVQNAGAPSRKPYHIATRCG